MINLVLLDKMSHLSASELRRSRQLLGVDQEDFGRLLGLSRRTISRLELGLYSIPVTVALSVKFLLSIAGIRDSSFTKSPVVQSLRSKASPPSVCRPESFSQPVMVDMESHPQPKKSGKNRKKKKRRGY